MHLELFRSKASTRALYWMSKHSHNDLDNVQMKLEMFQGPIFSINVRKSPRKGFGDLHHLQGPNIL